MEQAVISRQSTVLLDAQHCTAQRSVLLGWDSLPGLGRTSGRKPLEARSKSFTRKMPQMLRMEARPAAVWWLTAGSPAIGDHIYV